jgi:cytochrome P450 family 49 subfamily A
MAVRRRLLSGLRETRSLLVGSSGRRPHTTSLQPAAADGLGTDVEGAREVKPYSAVPGPRELPLIGNAWRFLPYIGKQPTAPSALAAVFLDRFRKPDTTLR